jgi:hypothetical protein
VKVKTWGDVSTTLWIATGVASAVSLWLTLRPALEAETSSAASRASLGIPRGQLRARFDF